MKNQLLALLFCLALLCGCSTMEIAGTSVLGAVLLTASDHPAPARPTRKQQEPHPPSTLSPQYHNRITTKSSRYASNSPQGTGVDRETSLLLQSVRNQVHEAVREFDLGEDYSRAYRKFQEIQYDVLPVNERADAYAQKAICALLCGRTDVAHASIQNAFSLNQRIFQSHVFTPYNPEIRKRLIQILP